MAVLSACSSPRWHAEAAPETAELYVDGAALPRRTVDAPIPYYGVVDLAAVPTIDATAEDGRTPLRAARGKLAIEPPVTPWIFPLDFVLELARLPFADDPLPALRLEAPPRQDVAVPGAPPPGREGFVVRARDAAIHR